MPYARWYAGVVTFVAPDLSKATIKHRAGGHIVKLRDASIIKDQSLDTRANKKIDFKYKPTAPGEVRSVRKRRRKRKVDKRVRDSVRCKYRSAKEQ